MPLEDLTPSNRFELALSGDMTAEEASNRIEKILAGADIEPADRLEYFLKLRVSGGGGGGGEITGDQYLSRYLSTERLDIYESFNSDTLKPQKDGMGFTARAETLCFWNMTGASSQYSSQWLLHIYAKTLVMPRVTRMCADYIKGAPNLEKLDIAPNRLDTNAIRDAGNLSTVIIRSASVPTLGNTSVFGETAFRNGGAGGTFYVPSSLIASYQADATWSVIIGANENNQILSIEGSIYETAYADGTPIS